MTKNNNFDFSEKQQELDQIVSELSDGTLSIDESLEKYKIAQKLIIELENYLQKSKNIITDATIT